jgi:hypothetical protein
LFVGGGWLGAFVNKAEFVQKAPAYYVAAICSELVGSYFPFTQEKLNEHFSGALRSDIFDEAIRQLESQDLIVVERDPFMAPVYGPSDKLSVWWSGSGSDNNPIIRRLRSILNEDRRDWLTNGLKALNDQAWRLGIVEEDFEQEPPDEWEPIPVDRSEPTFQAAEKALEHAIDEIQGSNGYAASAPEERTYVVAQLSAFARLLKMEAQIQWMQVKTFALEPLSRVIERFRTAAPG